jgi:UDP-N-acetylmuramoyl-tripeptide--D-alanyl-D-alanine ligase
MEYCIDIIKKILQIGASRVLRKYTPTVIAIIGGVGKTTTREYIYAVLSKKYAVRKSEKSLTTDLGVALTILGCSGDITTVSGWVANMWFAFRQLYIKTQYPEYVIVEIDGHTPGEVARVTEWLRIDVLVITPIGDIPPHVELFETPDRVRDDYRMILQALSPNSKIVVCADDEYAREIGNTSHSRVSYGIHPHADIMAGEYNLEYSNNVVSGMSFHIQKPEYGKIIHIPDTVGIHAVHGVLSSCAVMQVLGENPFAFLGQYEKVPALPGRMRLLSGIKDSRIIDDSYNSSLKATEEALSVLQKINAPRKIAVLGDMLELGRFSVEAHKEIGRQSVFVDILVCVGVRARRIGESALGAEIAQEKVFFFNTAEQAGIHIQQVLVGGDCVLVKGSQNMRMEKTVEEIMSEPEKSRSLLVRQEDYWLAR